MELAAGDLTRWPADVIVNAANSALAGGGGVDGAIHAAAGPTVMAELETRYRGCPAGSAVITGAGALPARWIVHAVGPIWSGGGAGEARLLASAYRSSLVLAHQVGATSVAFSAISCGVYGYPLVEAAAVSLRAVRDWVAASPLTTIHTLTWVLREGAVMAAFEEAFAAAFEMAPDGPHAG
jgi:O-acetyl-ADP-ribose deacetylase